MARAVGGGASAPSSSFAALERTLDQTIESLASGAQNKGEARARLIEARRLRSVIANWRSIPPPADVRDEMIERVRQLATSVGVPFPDPNAPEASGPVVSAAAGRVEAKAEAPRAAVKPQRAAAPAPARRTGTAARDEEDSEIYALDFEPHLYSLETAANRQAIPVPPADTRELEYGDAPVHSEEEPTRAWSNASVRPPPDMEAEMSATPAPWPVDEPHDRISSIISNGAPIVAVAAVAAVPSPPQPIAPAPAPVAAVRQPRASVASSPDLGPPYEPATDGAAGPRVVTYDFDAEGDDLSVPRTQIAAHAVRLSDPVNPLLVVLTDPYSPRTDAYRTLRRKLAGMPNARVLGITSANPGEGKTVFALNLALTLRESARNRVLVIEANLRAPIMAKLLGFETPEGFFAQLKRHEEDPRAPWVVAEPLPKLHVMAIDPSLPSERLLDPVSFSAGMERLKQAGYEYVIVDSPPVLGSLDCNVISDAVDAMILTALPMKSLRRDMRKAVEQLEPAPVLGVVVLEG